jgi:hypothetical protein
MRDGSNRAGVLPSLGNRSELRPRMSIIYQFPGNTSSRCRDDAHRARTAEWAGAEPQLNPEEQAIADYRRFQAGKPPRSFTPPRKSWGTPNAPAALTNAAAQPPPELHEHVQLRLVVNRPGEPIARRQIARLARAHASRAPPSGDSDSSSNDPDPDSSNAGDRDARSFFVPGGRA